MLTKKAKTQDHSAALTYLPSESRSKIVAANQIWAEVAFFIISLDHRLPKIFTHELFAPSIESGLLASSRW